MTTPVLQRQSEIAPSTGRSGHLAELEGHLQGEHAGHIFSQLKGALAIRAKEEAFHPEAAQEVLKTSDALFAFRRKGKAGSILVALNFTGKTAHLDGVTVSGTDLISGAAYKGVVALRPFQTVWIKEA